METFRQLNYSLSAEVFYVVAGREGHSFSRYSPQRTIHESESIREGESVMRNMLMGF